MTGPSTVDYFGGCDVGSTTGKAVILAGDAIVGSALVPSRMDPQVTAREALEAASAPLRARGFSRLAYLVGTGYGRAEVPFADENISEITCHAVGAHDCDPLVRTLIDIGGQDVKAVALNDDGSVREFAMNDKCAAGTGRFFEAMSRIFDLELDAFSRLSLGAKNAVPITAQCSVFAETEVVSLISQRHPPPDIAAGIQAAVAKRVLTLARRVGIRPKLTLTGGCAKNPGLLAALASTLRLEVAPLSVDPQLVGALGAAILARRRGPRRPSS
jgi:predicted CoA-substrate-specific enzyme activase